MAKRSDYQPGPAVEPQVVSSEELLQMALEKAAADQMTRRMREAETMASRNHVPIWTICPCSQCVSMRGRMEPLTRLERAAYEPCFCSPGSRFG